jgi:predicted O-methyltransferase YrrM
VSEAGTAAYTGWQNLPARVEVAVELARANGFACSCRPGQGELLRALVAGRPAAVIGETGTGYGVGLAWLAEGRTPGSRLVSIERVAQRAASAAALFRDDPAVTVLTGDWAELRAHGPFDVLVLDGGGAGKGREAPLDPAEWMNPGGTIVIDDFSPSTEWPPRFAGEIDTARLHWLTHPHLRATQVPVDPASVTVLATYVPDGSGTPRAEGPGGMRHGRRNRVAGCG